MRKAKANGTGKDIKAYLSRARYLDMRIRSALQQLEEISSLENCCAAGQTEDLKKIAELKDKVQNGLDGLIALKNGVIDIIQTVENPEQRTVLEKRYLCSQPWEKIAVDMAYNIRYVQKLHDRALEELGESENRGRFFFPNE